MKQPISIILLGDIAAGKDTQAKILAKKFRLNIISTGDFTRRKWGKDKRFDRAKHGQLSPSDLIKKFLVDSIKRTPAHRSLLINGGKMPSEARLIYRELRKQKRRVLVIYLSIPRQEILKRLSVRLTKEKRYDDRLAAVKNRIKYYNDIYTHTVKFWKSKGILKKINGKRKVKKVTADMVKLIEMFYGAGQDT